MENRFVEIPEIFYSFESKAPFRNCIQCEKELDEHTDYVIEKAMRRYPGFTASDTIFDYAMCMSCAFTMRNELSIRSRETMDQYFRPYMQKLQVKAMSGELHDTEQSLAKCIVTEKSIEEINEYQIYAFCRGNKLNLSVPTYMVSEDAIEQLLPLLSKETTDFLNGFFDKHFSPDPSLMEPIGPKLILV
jgi:hypothetical protein